MDLRTNDDLPGIDPVLAGLTPQVRTLQIIVSALTLGCLVAGVIFTVVLPRDNGPDNQVLMLIGLAFGLSVVAIRVVLPGMMVAAVRNRIAADPSDGPEARQALARIYVTTTIIAGALLEGGVMTNLVLYRVSHSLVNAAVAGLLFAGIPTLFPTTTSLNEWIDGQLQLSR